MVAGPYPYTLVYRVSARSIRVVRVLHQRRAYFQRVLREEMAEYSVKPRAHPPGAARGRLGVAAARALGIPASEIALLAPAFAQAA